MSFQMVERETPNVRLQSLTDSDRVLIITICKKCFGFITSSEKMYSKVGFCTCEDKEKREKEAGDLMSQL